MPIAIEAGVGDLGRIVEPCVFCCNASHHWHTMSNIPVCPFCAERRDASELAAAVKPKKLFLVESHTAVVKMATIMAGDVQEAKYSAFAVWDAAAERADEETPVGWGVSKITIIE